MIFEWVEPFLAALSKSPNVSEACRAAGISRTAAYKHREADPDFAAAWEDAVQQAIDDLVGEMYRRARDGVEKPVFYMGEECGRVNVFSDQLAMFLAKAHRPEVYGERSKVDLTSNGQTMGGQVIFYMPENGRDVRSQPDGDGSAAGPADGLPGDAAE